MARFGQYPGFSSHGGISIGPAGPVPPAVTGLIAVNAAVYVLQVLMPPERMIENFGLIPALPVITESEEVIFGTCPTGILRSGQPELQRFVRERAPHLDRPDEIPALARRFWQRRGEQGLWAPAF